MKCVLCDPGFCAVEDFKSKGVVLGMATCVNNPTEYGDDFGKEDED